MHQELSAILAALCFVMASCIHFQKPDHDWATTLEQDLQSAQPIMHKFDLKKMENLRQQLHRRLIEEGDEKFARTLELQTDEVQTEVCNIMGLLEESRFDRFPKTRHALSAAPKI